MKPFDLLHFLAVIVLCYVGLYLLRFVLVWHRMLRLRWQEPRFSRAATADVPTHLDAGLSPPIAELESLGFERIGWISCVPALQDILGVKFEALLGNRSRNVYATVGFSSELNPAQPYAVVFRSFAADGRAVRTFNGVLHGLVDRDPSVVDVDPYAPTLEAQWKAHCAALDRNVFESLQLEPEQVAEAMDTASRRGFALLCDAGVLVRQGDGLVLRWTDSVRVTYQVVRGARRVGRMLRESRHLRVRSPPLPPIEEEVRAYLVQEGITRAPSRRNFYLWVFLATLLLFVVSMTSYGSFGFAATVLGVVTFHELGHYLAMRAFGYQDTTVFFIPFLGGVATGSKPNATLTQEMLILLAGPVPGLALAGILWVAGLARVPVGKEILTSLVAVNLFNLLPILPLDGGRVMQLLLFARSPKLDVVARLLAVTVFGLLAYKLSSPVFAILAVFGLIALPQGRRLAELQRRVQPALAPLAREARITHVYREMRDMGLGALPLATRLSLARTALRQQGQSARVGCLTAFGWLALYTSIVVVVFAAIVASHSKNRVAAAPEPTKFAPVNLAPSQCPSPSETIPAARRGLISLLAVFNTPQAASIARDQLRTAMPDTAPYALNEALFVAREMQDGKVDTGERRAPRPAINGPLHTADLPPAVRDAGGKWFDLGMGTAVKVECRVGSTEKAFDVSEVLADYLFFNSFALGMLPPPWGAGSDTPPEANAELRKARRTLRALYTTAGKLHGSKHEAYRGGCSGRRSTAIYRERWKQQLLEAATALRSKEALDEGMLGLALQQASDTDPQSLARIAASISNRAGASQSEMDPMMPLHGEADQDGALVRVKLNIIWIQSLPELQPLVAWLCGQGCGDLSITVGPLPRAHE